jgi:hypothetical protein
MIPVEPSGGSFQIALAASLACLTTLLTWVAVLCTTPAARYRLRANLKRSLVFMGLLALFGTIFPAAQIVRWLAARDAAADLAAHTSILSEARMLDGIPMPAGTRLRLREPGDESSYESALFPRPVRVAGVEAIRLRRYFHADAAGQYELRGATAVLEKDQVVGGWVCSRGHGVEFKPGPGTTGLQFSSCHLTQGNDVGGHAVPPGTWLSVLPAATTRQSAPAKPDGKGADPAPNPAAGGTGGAVTESAARAARDASGKGAGAQAGTASAAAAGSMIAGSGGQAPAAGANRAPPADAARAAEATNPMGWLLRTDGSEAINVAGMPLLKADVRLDAQRRVIGFEGTLADGWKLGPMSYPTGTRVMLAPKAMAGARPGDLIFSPSRGRSAQRQGSPDISAGNSVIQSPAGDVRAVVSNREAGVLDFATISVAP